jgi:Phasin protein
MYAFAPFSFSWDTAAKAASSQMTVAAQAFAPWMKAAARTNLELMALTSRRARATMDLASRAGTCRTPQDVMQEQTQFWQTAAQDWMESSGRITAAWLAAAPTSFAGAWRGPAAPGNGVDQSERDLVSFPDPKTPRSSDERQAA